MRKTLWLLALILAWAEVAQGHSSQGFDPAPACTIATMLQGRCGTSAGDRAWVIDSTSASGCSTGGGTFQHECTRQADGTWAFPTGGGSGDIGGMTDTGNLCAADQVVVRNAGDTGFTCATAAGDVTAVGDCSGGACFTGATGTTLFSNTDIIVDVDEDNNANEQFIVRGTAGTLFTVDEGSSGSFVNIAGDLLISDGWPAFFITDSQFPDVANVLITAGCATDNDCGWQISNESGSAGTRVGMLAVRTADAGTSLLYLGGAQTEGESTVPTDGVTVDEAGVMSPIGTGEIQNAFRRCLELDASNITCAATNGCTAGTVDGTLNSFMTADFNTTADSFGSWNFTVPRGWTGVTVTVEIDWMSTDGACNAEAADTVCWSFDSGSVADLGAFTSPTLGGTARGITDTCNSTGQLMHATFPSYVHGMTSGTSAATSQRGVFTLSRDVDTSFVTGCTADGYGADARLIGVRICRD